MLNSRREKKLVSALSPVLVTLFLLVAAPPAFAALDLTKEEGEKTIKLSLYGFSQLEVRQGDGLASGSDGDMDDDGLRFTAQRIRVGFNYHYGKVFGKLFIDFNRPYDKSGGGLPEVIKDAFVGYKFSNAAFVKLGMFKTPLGMDFTIPGWNLDIVERGSLEKALVLERDMGFMLSGRLLGDEKAKISGREMGHEAIGRGFGYDIGIFNPAGRSGAVKGPDDFSSSDPRKLEAGDALAYVGRLHYDFGSGGKGKPRHLEVAYAVNEAAGGFTTCTIDTDGDGTLDTTIPDVETEDYKVFDIGANFFLVDGKLNLKGEYISGQNIQGVKGRDQSTWVVTAGYMVHPKIEAVVKHYSASATRDDSSSVMDTDLTNTYIGFNYYLEPQDTANHRKLQSHKIAFNYVMTGGDDGYVVTDTASGRQKFSKTWTGVGGKVEDYVVLLWQYKY